MKMTQEELNEILRKHKLWLDGKKGGERADLTEANLTGLDLTKADLTWANFTGADLSRANFTGADLSWAKFKRADLTGAVLTRANLYTANLTDAKLTRAVLSWTNLTDVNLTDADLAGAYIDFSSLPLWCGSLKANFDDRQLIQIAYHLVKAGLNSTNASNETKEELAKLIDFANRFHRVGECGKIEWRSMF